ncbi:hypothetical protein LC20004_15030 (plasmid) [Loigolactobacillus coryniformis subsp. torquens DSM 20004 = KCTC 3535]|uniref:Type I restriction modification DNA specificity domain-containing protein n=2 Tax=Loigolactobacillus coryniformis TaxID=1610 RepID=A0A2D1KSZ6_9LACO|nr:restriction endonuclease subunit S [Loigolactobacillus coryniformis]ATO45234.1 hypothetical protein LC20004_15030 [Loigolactobacillus coryniformis subsp. torquens DSM 20004 = KCTC 3535]
MSNKVPQIRFNGYSDAWEERKFGELYKKVNEKNDLSLGKDRVISVANMYFKDTGNIRSDDAYMKTYNIFRTGDIAFEGNRSKHFSYGRFVENTIGDGIVSHVFDVFRPIQQFDLNYWKYAIHNERVMGPILMTATTSSTMMTNLVAKDFLKRAILVPSYSEQKLVGSFFKQLDDTIALHQRKLDLLKEQKKGFLQKMFPKNGAKVPELRFAGFADDWEERKFGELYKKVNEKNDLSFGKDRVISVANMYFKDTGNIRSDDAYMKTYNIFRTGDIAFEGNRSKHFSYGRFVENTIGDGIVSHVFDVFRPIQQFDLNYWKYAIHNERVMGPILMTATTSSTMMTNLVAKDFLKRAILVPSYSEQKLVGSFFKQLDDTIALHQRKLDLLKEQKKGFLQKMFV